jgi:hypothetical protein
MKMLIIGLDGAAPEMLFGDEHLINFHRVMEFGCYGWLESNRPLTAEKAWLSLATGQDPGSLPGITIWDQVIRQGDQAIIAGWLPFEIAEAEGLIVHRFDDRLLDAEDLATGDQAGLKDRIYSTGRGQFETVGQLLQSEAWNYFQFIETGLGRIGHDPDPIFVRAYYRHLDAQLGSILGMLSDDTMILVSFIQVAPAPSPQPGFFILAAPNNPLIGEVEGAQLIDIAPTLLELGGYDIPDAMQGRSLVSGVALDAASGLSVDEEEILRERLSGLGYIS